MLKAYAASSRKESRIVNEDSFGMLDGRFYVVADGVSSKANADIASREAVRLFIEYFGEATVIPSDRELNNFLVLTGNTVRRQSDGSASTVVSAWFVPTTEETVPFFGVNVGDSRLYILDTRGEPVLRQLSRDHSVRLYDWRRLCYRMYLTASCGGGSLSDVTEGTVYNYLAPGEWLILASDGAWRYMEKNREWFLKSISEFREQPQERVDFLARTAAREMKDDSTIIIVMNEPSPA